MIVVCFNKMAPRLVEHATSKNNLSKFGESSILQSRLAVVLLPSSCRVLQLKTEIIWLLPLRVGSHNVDLVTRDERSVWQKDSRFDVRLSKRPR